MKIHKVGNPLVILLGNAMVMNAARDLVGEQQISDNLNMLRYAFYIVRGFDVVYKTNDVESSYRGFPPLTYSVISAFSSKCTHITYHNGNLFTMLVIKEFL